MGWLALGFFLGFLVAFWGFRNSHVFTPFHNFLNKEIGYEGLDGRVHTVKTRVDDMEKRLQYLEGKLTETPFPGEYGSKEVINFPEQRLRQADSLQDDHFTDRFTDRFTMEGPSSHNKNRTTERAFNSKKKKNKSERVMKLWQEGKVVEQIVKETGLGQGEVDLILSLRNKTGTTDT